MNDIKQKIKEAHWYAVTNDGRACLCADAFDATKEAHGGNISWPKFSPHTATQLVPMALVDQLTAHMEGEASVMRAILSEADSVLSTIEPDDTDEAQALGELRRKIKAVLFPDADQSLF